MSIQPNKKRKKEKIPKDLLPKITILPKLVEFTFNGHKITLNHYLQSRWWCSHHEKLHFFGHSHKHANPTGRAIDVEIDPQNFFPIPLEIAIQSALEKPFHQNHSNHAGRIKQSQNFQK